MNMCVLSPPCLSAVGMTVLKTGVTSFLTLQDYDSIPFYSLCSHGRELFTENPFQRMVVKIYYPLQK